MNWTHNSTLEMGPVRMSIQPGARPAEWWQFFIMDFGSHSNASREECLKTWPREAIARARKALDEFENLLEQDYETAMERRQADG